MSINRHSDFARKIPYALVGLALAMGPLSACSTVEKGWKSTKSTVGGIFGGKSDKAAPPPADDATSTTSPPAETAPPITTGGGGLFMGSGGTSGAFRSSDAPPTGLSSAPATPAKAAAAPPAPKKTTEGLVADHKSEYSEQVGRQAPVTVRPLNDNPAVADANVGGPPRPQAAPTERVTRLAEVPPTPAPSEPDQASTPARTTALADRLGAAPPPQPASTPPTSPMAAPTSPVAVTPTVPATPSAPARIQPLIPSNTQIASYGNDTVVVDGSGVRGGRNVLRPQQMASVPRASFDPGNASVSSEVGTISFGMGSAALSAQAKAVLSDVAKLRAQVEGAIRIVGRGDQASARAASISRELRRLGVPSTRLYDGGADNTMLGDEADIYLDY